MKTLLKQIPSELVNIEEEIPVLLAIMKKEGITIFSYPFHEEWTFDSQLFSGFLTAFNTFSGEIFAASLDRANFWRTYDFNAPLASFRFMLRHKRKFIYRSEKNPFFYTRNTK